MRKTVGIILASVALYAPPALAQDVVAGRVGGSANGRVQPLNVDATGRLASSTAGTPNAAVTTVQGVSGGTPVTVTAQTPGNNFCHISTATTTVCKSGAGALHTLSVNNLGTVASVTTVYNNTAGSGAVIAVINTLAGQTSYVYDVTFTIGLTVVTTGTVAPDITISYR